MRLALYAAVLVAGFVGVSLLVFWLAVRPPRLTVPLAPRDFGLAVEDVAITTDDGIRLAAWLVPRQGAPAVVLLHGYPADRATMLPIAAGLASRFTVLLLDQRLFVRDDITRPAPVEAAAVLAVPVLLIASREDDQIPFAHAERLHEALAANPRAEFVFTARGRHGELAPDFAARLARFFLLYVR